MPSAITSFVRRNVELISAIHALRISPRHFVVTNHDRLQAWALALLIFVYIFLALNVNILIILRIGINMIPHNLFPIHKKLILKELCDSLVEFADMFDPFLQSLSIYIIDCFL